jgi:GH25 family lysozyme M1 (1,4-beta-N-acetylmuramidase)
MYQGIDISSHNGAFNIKSARDNGIRQVIIQAGYGHNNIDRRFEQNAQACVNLQEPAGIYWFSYALSAAMAAKEAEYAIAAAKKYWKSCIIAYDMEYDSVAYARRNGVNITKAIADNMAIAFLSAVAAAGYTPVLYANLDYLRNYYNLQAISAAVEQATRKTVYLWYARYTATLPTAEREGVHIWQNSDKGSIPGIIGRVDSNIFFTDFTDLSSSAAKTTKSVCNINIQAFQTAANTDGYRDAHDRLLAEDGIDGPNTQDVRKRIALQATRRIGGYSVGSTGALVKYWQRRLSEMGCKTSIDGRFGADTRIQTIAWQKAFGLKADGIVGYNTLSTSFYH